MEILFLVAIVFGIKIFFSFNEVKDVPETPTTELEKDEKVKNIYVHTAGHSVRLSWEWGYIYETDKRYIYEGKKYGKEQKYSIWFNDIKKESDFPWKVDRPIVRAQWKRIKTKSGKEFIYNIYLYKDMINTSRNVKNPHKAFLYIMIPIAIALLAFLYFYFSQN
jgi:hypothetical protein